MINSVLAVDDIKNISTQNENMRLVKLQQKHTMPDEPSKTLNERCIFLYWRIKRN